MSSIQERLQLKRVPLDTWNVREQLCLASAVVRSGDQNWMSVSRALKTVGDPNRPSDWYSQKSCAAQYGTLLEHVETPKRKKRNSEGLGETPQESILKRLTQDRITEIQKTIADMNKQYETLKTEITEIRNPATSDERIQTMWSEVEASISAKERDSATRAAWLREREERRARAERTWRPQHQPLPPTSAPPSSPLLTSLLKSSPVVTTPQHISHPANVVDSISPSAGAPTLSMLLEKCAPPACAASPAPPLHDNKHAAIEHIKSQLVQIEHQLKASSSAGATPVLAPPPPPLDIDDIEIKAEDVYAFRDVDIEIPPVAAMHKPPPARVVDRPAMPKKEEMLETVTETMPTDQIMQDDEKMQDVVLEESTDEISNVETSTEEPVPEPAPPSPKVMENPVEVKISLLEVKFPTPEIKIRQPEEKVIKEEIKEPTSQTRPEVLQSPQEAEVTLPAVEKTINIPEEPQEPEVTAPPVEETPAESVAETKANVETEAEEVSEETVDVPDPPGESIDSPADAAPAASESAPPLPPPHSPEDTIEQQLERMQGPDGDDDRPLHEIKEQEEQEDSKPLKDMISETRQDKHDAAFKQEKETEDTHTETDDDTPMELSREEEKDGKKRRDYSRKKKPDSRTCSGSESAAETSAPDSPTTCDAERQHRLWKKSLMLVYSRLSAHKYASLFQRPITDEQAPGYSVVVKRPMDLSTIKRNIDTGVVRTTAEFQRDVLLMLTNALMYNSSEHTVYEMAKEMFNEAETQLGMLLAAQAHAELGAAPEEAGGAPSRRRRLAEKRRHEQT